MKGRRWGIGVKFFIFISISVIFFLASAFLISRRVFRDFALRSADEIASTILDQTDKRLAQFFRDLQFAARALAGTKAVRRAEPEGMRDLFLATVRAREAHLRAVYLGTADGRMFEWGVGEGFTDNVPSFPPGYDPRRRPWYELAASSGSFGVSAPYRYASVEALGITCVLPVKGEDGSFAGVLGLDILLEDLASILVGLEIPQGGKALILSPSGEIIASQFPEDRGPRLELKRFDLAGGEAVLARGSGSFVGSVGGQRTLFVHKRAESFDWIIAVGMPLEAIMAPVNEILDLVTAIDLLLMILFVLALAAITTKLIVSPLNHVVAVVDRIEGGEAEARVEAGSSDEFGQLGDELNRLLDTVAENSRDLEAKVAQRTEELWRLQRENTQLRLREERQRIYRDMHDTIGAKLTNVFFCNGVARDLARGFAGEGSKELREMHERIEANCLQAIKRLKEIILGMKADERLAADFSKRLAAGMRQRLRDGGIDFDCRVRGREALNAIGPEARDEIEKIFDELVSNVLKHAGARRVRARIGLDGRALSIRFSDDGRGFDPAAAGPSSAGLANIRYRAERLGGSVEIASSPGEGARFAIEAPAGRLAARGAREEAPCEA
ncbi:MAG TPA: cache domain-containing protein [Spirochaetales bacterium]|nr:cache domain-containing protein [Spirochaetales bacterium]HRY54251.1 cache domain-containing protein [Spirochaetia bacterium]HRZ63996.1 cache domain-containing protein [Spirochaetia bacterium]